MSKKSTKKQRKAALPSEPVSPQKIARSSTSPVRGNMINWLIVLVLLLPVIFSRVAIDPTITSRYIFLSIFTLLFVLYFYVIRKAHVSLTFPRLTKLVFGLSVAFGCWSIVSLTNAINLAEGYYQVARYFLFLILLFIIMVAVTKEESRLLALCKAFIILSLVQSIVGIFQYYEIAFDDIPGANAKPYGLMANRNLFGSAQMLVLPFLVFVVYKANAAWKYAAGLALALTISSIIISQTRSAWLASMAIMVISLVLVSVFSPALRKKWIIGTLSGAAGIALLLLLIMSTDEEGSLSKSVKERAGSLAFSSTDTSQASANADERLKMWSRTVKMIKDHPVTGVGPGNWKITIPPYGGGEIIWAYGNFIPDRPHNVYLHLLSETGVPGAIFYFGTWILLAVIAIKTIIKTKSSDSRILTILMFSGLAGFAVDCFFSFPSERFEHSVYMTLMAGIILGNHSLLAAANPGKLFAVNKKLALLFAAIIAFNLFLAFKKHNFEIHMNRAKAYEKQNNYLQILSEVEEGRSSFVTVDPDSKPLEMYSGLAYKGLKDFPKAIEQMYKAKKYNPNSFFVYNNMGTVYTEMKKYDSAIINYRKALEITPRFAVAYKNLAVNYFLSGNYPACIEAIGNINITGDQYFTGMLNEAQRLSQVKK